MTAYYLLLKKNLKLGMYSTSDICSPVFDRSLLVSKLEASTAHASVNSSFTATSKNVRQHDKTEDTIKTIDEIDLGRNTNTSNGFRIGSRAINRLQIR